jgi:hypothetical protein
MAIMRNYMEDIKQNKRFTIIKYILLGSLLIFVLYKHIHVSPQFERGQKQTEQLQNITEADISKIELCESEMCDKKIELLAINSKKSKVLFSYGMNDLSDYFPNHDRAIQEFFIIMHDRFGDKYEFDVYLKDHNDHTAYIHLLERPDDEKVFLRNLGSRKSKKLYNWLKYHNLIQKKV